MSIITIWQDLRHQYSSGVDSVEYRNQDLNLNVFYIIRFTFFRFG
jgi:hypothetical protein